MYYNDISFTGNLQKIWGYKLGNYKKHMEYFRYDYQNERCVNATDDEIKSINKSFIKKHTKNPILFNKLIGFIDLKMPQKKMVFKIRDKRSEGKKGTQIKTGSICNNDGMKKSKIIEYIEQLKAKTIYSNNNNIPNKSTLCLELEQILNDLDLKDTKYRYLYGPEETIEYELNKKN